MNPDRYPTSKMTDFQQTYVTKMKKQNEMELKSIQEAENKLENRMK
jgi:hypothetical protein